MRGGAFYREKWINWVTGLDWEKRKTQTAAAITATITQMPLFFTKGMMPQAGCKSEAVDRPYYQLSKTGHYTQNPLPGLSTLHPVAFKAFRRLWC